MKKFFVPFVLIFICSCFGCTKATAQKNDKLSYNEILSLPKIRSNEPYREIFNDLHEALGFYSNESKGRSCSLVSGEVTSVKYFYEWTGDLIRGYSIAELHVNEVSKDYNSAGIKPGETKFIRQANYIGFANEDDTFSFFSQKFNKEIACKEELDATSGGVFELNPLKDEQYVLHISDNQIPLGEGENYTMLVYNNDYVYNDVTCCSSLYIKPLALEPDLKSFSEQNDFIYDSDCVAIAEEIAALFE